MNLRKWRATGVEPEVVLSHVFRYWREQAQELGCPEIAVWSEVSRQAVVDYLEKPDKLGWGDRPVVPEVHRRSCYRWLFGVPGVEGDLSWICHFLGPNIAWMRELIVETAVAEKKLLSERDGEGSIGPLFEFSNSELTCSEPQPQTDRGGDSNAEVQESW